MIDNIPGKGASYELNCISVIFLAAEITVNIFKNAWKLIVSFGCANFEKIITIHGKFMQRSFKKIKPIVSKVIKIQTFTEYFF